MKAVILNGSGGEDSLLNSSQEILAGELKEMGWEVRGFVLREMEIPHCLGCFGCWVRTPGLCIIKDVTRDIAGNFIGSDLAVLLTPVTFGGYSSELKKALDRMICLISPFFRKVRGEIHHRPRYDRYPRWMAVGALPEPEPLEEATFSRLVERNAINLYAPNHVSGILLKNQGDDEIRPYLRNLLGKIGVIQ